MSRLPVDPTRPYRFSPLADAVTRAEGRLAECEEAHRKAVIEFEAEAKSHQSAGTAPEDLPPATRERLQQLSDAVATASEDLETAAGACEALRQRLASETDQPVYLVRVPTYRLNARFDDAEIELTTAPSNRAMLRAIEEAAVGGALSIDHPDLIALRDHFRVSGGSEIPDHLSGAFEELFDLTRDTAPVRALLRRRNRAREERVHLKVRHFLIGIEGEADLPRDGDTLAESATDVISPLHVELIARKVDELQTMPRRLGNSSAA